MYGPEGDFIEATVIAEGADTGDKAGNKLMSGAYKYALGQVLSLPYAMEDQDATIPEPVGQASNGELLAKLRSTAAALGQDVETITAKFRNEQGGMTMEQFNQLPPERLRPFVRAVVNHAGKQAAK